MNELFPRLSQENETLWRDSLLAARDAMRQAGFSDHEWHIGGSSSFYHLFRTRMPRDVDIFTEKPFPDPVVRNSGLLPASVTCQPSFLRGSAGTETARIDGSILLFKKPHRTFEFKIYCRNGILSENDIFDMASAMFFLGPDVPRRMIMEGEIIERCGLSLKRSGHGKEISGLALAFIRNIRIC